MWKTAVCLTLPPHLTSATTNPNHNPSHSNSTEPDHVFNQLNRSPSQSTFRKPNQYASHSSISKKSNHNPSQSTSRKLNQKPSHSTSSKLNHNTVRSSSTEVENLCRSGRLHDAVHLLQSKCPDEIDVQTYSLLLHGCISKRSIQDGERLHRLLLRSRLFNSPTLQRQLITMYALCGRIDDARRVFDGGSPNDPSRSAWEAMLVAYSRNGRAEDALVLYSEMLKRSVLPGNFAFSAVLKACFELSELRLGRAVHARLIKSEEVVDQVVNNALLRLYTGGNGCLVDAHQLFQVMPQRNVVSWNSLLTGLVQEGRLAESLELFRRMQSERVGFSWVTFTIILPVCARLTALHSGQEIHAHIIKANAEPDIPVCNSLMDMYAKCGFVELSRSLFDKTIDRDIMTWNIMLTGYAVNGCANDALKSFEKMVEVGFRPDAVTFIAVLSSCSHAGLVAEGQRLYYRMEEEFGISPTVEHYACLVDLLGRAGHIKEALDVVEDMHVSPSGSIWGSLLNSCRLYGNIELGEDVAKKLFELEPNNAGNYVMLSNMYASAGRWENVKKLREFMDNRGIKKEVGCSWVQIRNRIFTFAASGSVSFRQSEEYKRVWKELMESMKEAGYVLNTGIVLHDVNDEMKAMWICEHSERLAVVFALIHTGNEMPIRITKNLRICVDCHSAMKAISKVTRRVIVLRDTNRFHHFANGACSCRDYW